MNIELPSFITDRLILRAVTRKDIPSYQKHFADYDVIQHLSAHVPWPYPDNGAEWFLENHIFPFQGSDVWLWGLFEKNNPCEVIGAVHLWRKGSPENRGFWLGKKFWGQGYMTEAVHPIMDYAFEHLGFDKLIFANAVGNTRSGRVKEKTGAKLIDVLPAKFVNPEYTEHQIWELQKENWKSNLDYYFISSNKDLLIFPEIHKMLTTAYWCEGISLQQIQNASKNSICFGIYNRQEQVGYARLITDQVTFAWLCDVFIHPDHRGHGLSKELMRFVLNRPELQKIKRILLGTKDAHELYEKFGFKSSDNPNIWMEIKNMDVYRRT